MNKDPKNNTAALNNMVRANGGELKKLAESRDGEVVKKILSSEKDDLMQAFENGDTEKLSAALKNVMSTEEGSRFIGQIASMFGK